MPLMNVSRKTEKHLKHETLENSGKNIYVLVYWLLPGTSNIHWKAQIHMRTISNCIFVVYFHY